MLQVLDLRGIADLDGRLPRPRLDDDEPVAAVRAILDDVRTRGDDAVRDLTERFDGARVDDPLVPADAVRAALDELTRRDPQLVDALRAAADAIRAFHETQLVDRHTHEHNGVVVESWRAPLRRAGCYVPGGRAAYPSTVLMTAVPAKVAGVAEVALCVPPGPDGAVPPV